MKLIIKIIDIVGIPFVFIAGHLLLALRKMGVARFPLLRRTLSRVGIFPISDHYYEPLFNTQTLKNLLSTARSLPGIDWVDAEQVALLEKLNFADELKGLPQSRTSDTEFYINNKSFGAGDAEYWYSLIRAVKPKRIIEIGSGNSTLMAFRALKKNRENDADYRCEHICIEPYEQPWLEKTGAKIIRERVEDIPLSFFAQLENSDILFIDSSHIIRPQGDVLHEYLQILPTLNPGVIVHVHDIFSPHDYPKAWLVDQVRFWNEQYLLEAFLTQNDHWGILGGLNYLRHRHFNELKAVCPYLTEDREPGSFYIRRKL